MKKISIVIPVYNEGPNVEMIYGEVCLVFEQGLKEYELEIIFSDNCSSDDTYARIKKLQATDSRVRGICLSRNFGYQANILTGYLNATGDAVVQLDADGEDPPELIKELVRLWEEGSQVVYGIRVKRQEAAWLQWTRNIFYSLLQRISEVKLPPGAGDFRLIDRSVVAVLADRFPESGLYLRGLTSFIGFRQVGFEYERKARASGKSKFSLLQYFLLAFDAITAFSKVPLKLVAAAGVILSLTALFGGVIYLVLHLSGQIVVRGFTTLILVLLMVSGVQLMALGILGEYIARIFDEVKARPRSIIAKHCGFTNPPESA